MPRSPRSRSTRPPGSRGGTQSRRDTTFGHLLVRVVAETAQHAGHCDIVRETIDGRAGSNTGDVPADEWAPYVARIQAAAETFR